jgi:hypothetical protein
MCRTNLKQFYKKVKFLSNRANVQPFEKEILVNAVINYLTSEQIFVLYGPLPMMPKNGRNWLNF